MILGLDKETFSNVYDFKFEKPLNGFILSACNHVRFLQICCAYVDYLKQAYLDLKAFLQYNHKKEKLHIPVIILCLPFTRRWTHTQWQYFSYNDYGSYNFSQTQNPFWDYKMNAYWHKHWPFHFLCSFTAGLYQRNTGL